jgi:putative transcriptional regulator
MVANDDLQNRLPELRARYRLTQQDLAQRVGVTRQTIIAIEKGQYNPSTTLALKLARTLQVPVEQLFWLGPQPAAASLPHLHLQPDQH